MMTGALRNKYKYIAAAFQKWQAERELIIIEFGLQLEFGGQKRIWLQHIFTLKSTNRLLDIRPESWRTPYRPTRSCLFMEKEFLSCLLPNEELDTSTILMPHESYVEQTRTVIHVKRSPELCSMMSLK